MMMFKLLIILFPLIASSAAAFTHSYETDYSFDQLQGWQPVQISNLDYKYPRDDSTISKGTITHVLNQAWNSLKGIGKATSVIITWYTGQDLKNPSCWENTEWAPTDQSFACAVTENGWTTRPKCFQFLEICHGTKKCIFVRVVDSCAGCAAGSRHVDLTKAAFEALASLDIGILTVQMRIATEPSTWNTGLWGPKTP